MLQTRLYVTTLVYLVYLELQQQDDALIDEVHSDRTRCSERVVQIRPQGLPSTNA